MALKRQKYLIQVDEFFVNDEEVNPSPSDEVVNFFAISSKDPSYPAHFQFSYEDESSVTTLTAPIWDVKIELLGESDDKGEMKKTGAMAGAGLLLLGGAGLVAGAALGAFTGNKTIPARIYVDSLGVDMLVFIASNLAKALHDESLRRTNKEESHPSFESNSKCMEKTLTSEYGTQMWIWGLAALGLIGAAIQGSL